MAQNIDFKKSTLDDDASIYQKKEERDDAKTAKQKWSSLNKTEKKQYFKDYYMKPLLVGAFILVLVVYAVYTSIRDNTVTKFYLAVMNEYYMDNEAMEEHLAYLEEYWDLSRRERTVYSTDLTLSDSASLSTFVTYLYAGSLNAIIGTEEQLAKYGYYFTDFEKELPEEIYNQIPEEAWCVLNFETQDPDQEAPTPMSSCCAVYVKYTVFADNFNKNVNIDTDDLILVIPVTGSDKEAVDYNMDFFKYAFGLELGE